VQKGIRCKGIIINKPKESKMEKKYKTKPIDFTGCHPVIAEHLKRSETVLCDVWDTVEYKRKKQYVCGYRRSGFPYVTAECTWSFAEPVEIKTERRVLDQVRLMQVLTEQGYKANTGGERFEAPDRILTFNNKIWCCCGKEAVKQDKNYTSGGFTFYESWTEEIEVQS
jgi:hypothetical protein